MLDDYSRLTFRGQEQEDRFRRGRRYRRNSEIGTESASESEEENPLSPRIPLTYCVHENCERETTWAHGMVPAGVCGSCFGMNSEECIEKGGYCRSVRVGAWRISQRYSKSMVFESMVFWDKGI